MCICKYVCMYIHTMEDYSAIKKETLPFVTTQMDPEGRFAKGKAGRERRITYSLIYMQNRRKTKSQVQSTDWGLPEMGEVGEVGEKAQTPVTR